MSLGAWLKNFWKIIAGDAHENFLELPHNSKCSYCHASITEEGGIAICSFCGTTIHLACVLDSSGHCLRCSRPLVIHRGKIHITISGAKAEEVELVAASLLNQVRSRNETEGDKDTIIRILFLAANPRDTLLLRLGEEIHTIDLALQRTSHRERFDINQYWAVRVTDLQNCLLKVKNNRKQ